MPLLVNLQQLEKQNLVLQGELDATEMEWNTRDEVIRVSQPFHYRLQVQRVEKTILVQGTLRQAVDCQCVRCLKEFCHEVSLENWTCLLDLEGEEQVAVLNDCVDLTLYFREDIFLALPQHPVCNSQCLGLAVPHQDEKPGGWDSSPAPSVWAELNKLKLK